MKYSVNGTVVSLESSILDTSEIDKALKEANKAVEAFNIVSNVKAMESFGYKATEGLGENIANGVKAIWKKIKEIFRKIIEFFKRIFRSKKIENTAKKAEEIPSKIKKAKALANFEEHHKEFERTHITISRSVYNILNNPRKFIDRINYLQKEIETSIDEIDKCAKIVIKGDFSNYSISDITDRINRTMNNFNSHLGSPAKVKLIDFDFLNNDNVDIYRETISIPETLNLFENNISIFSKIRDTCHDFINCLRKLSLVSNDLSNAIDKYEKGFIPNAEKILKNDNGSVSLFYSVCGKFFPYETRNINSMTSSFEYIVNEITKGLNNIIDKCSDFQGK